MSSSKTSQLLSAPPRRRPGRPAGRTTRDGVIADRETLLAAAEQLIRERGTGVSLDMIAAAAGVTKPVLYRGVGDRNALVNALAQRLAVRMSKGVRRQIARPESTRDALQRLVNGYLRQAAKERALYLYVSFNGTGDDPVRQSLFLADETARGLAARIAAIRAVQDADASVATAWAYGIVGALHFVTLWWLRDAALSREKLARQVTEMLWSGLQPGLEHRERPGKA